MDIRLDDTIAALASPPGPGARGIVRVGGLDVRDRLETLLHFDEPNRWRNARLAAQHRAAFTIPDCPVPLPVNVLLWPHARSYTGQPLAELHIIGSPPLLEAVLSEIFDCGIRPARPGEFTLRAFLAGRIDLVQAEAVLGVIDAPDHWELETALSQLAGGVSTQLGAIREDLIHLVADLEAGLDFVEEDIEFVRQSELVKRVVVARNAIAALLDQAADRIVSTGRSRVVLAGLPNAGKSSLFNALCGHDAALVSEVSGTTRDYLRAELDWHGSGIELFDTAGWDTQSDALMNAAHDFRDEQIDRADLVVWCTPRDIDPSQRDVDISCRNQLSAQSRPLLVVETKCDLPEDSFGDCNLFVSARTGHGVDELTEAAAAQLSALHLGARQLLGTTASRCRESLAASLQSLDRAAEVAQSGLGDEIVSIEIRETLEHLGRILGVVYTEDILDRLFSKFCIGK